MSTATDGRASRPTPATVTLDDYLRALYPPETPGDLLAYVKEPFTRRFGA